MLPVSSRVTSTEPRYIHPAQLRQQPRLRPQVGRAAATQVRRDLVQQRAEQPADLCQLRLLASRTRPASAGENLTISACRAAGSAGSRRYRPSTRGAKYGPCG